MDVETSGERMEVATTPTSREVYGCLTPSIRGGQPVAAILVCLGMIILNRHSNNCGIKIIYSHPINYLAVLLF